MKINDKIQEYLSKGGLFNPELMQHDKVRDLIMECDSTIKQLESLVKMHSQRRLERV
jgi:hypothetical protein